MTRNFAYTARDSDGNARSGTAMSVNAAALAGDLRGRGWLVLDLRPQDDRGSRTATARDWSEYFRPGPRRIDVELGLRQMALMERSGLPLLQALRAAAVNSRRKAMGRVWSSVADRIEAGSTFTDALAEHPRQFPDLVIALVRSGEKSGTLDQALDRSAEHLERSRELRANVLSALLYPSIVIALAMAVGLFMVINVVPVLEGFLSSSGKKLPFITAALVDVSHWVRAWGAALAISIPALIFALFVLDRFLPTRRMIDRALYALPIVKSLRVLSATSTFSRSLATLSSNGIDLVQSLVLCEGIMPRPLAKESIARARQRVLAGDNLAAGMNGSIAFAPILPKMIDVGERSGALDTVLFDVARFHEDAMRAWVKRASTIIEPVVTLVVGGIVGFVYIAFFVALFGAAGAIK